MWRIQNELDFLIVKNAMLGVRDAIFAQVSVLLILIYFLYPYVPVLYLLLWGSLHLFAYGFRFGINSFYQQLNNSQEHYVIATSLLRFYTVGLAFTSFLWGSSILFLSYIPEVYHFIVYMLIFGFTFASVMSIGPILSMYLAYALPMNLAVFMHLLFHEKEIYWLVAFLLLMAFIYSLRSSRFYFSIYHSLIEEKLNVEKALAEIERKEHNKTRYLQAIENIGLGIIVTDITDMIIEINAPIRNWFGDITRQTYGEFIAKNVVHKEQNASKECFTTKNGKTFEVTSKTIEDLDSNKGRFILLKDITQETRNKKIMEDEKKRYKERSELDALTNALNRESFIQQLTQLSYEADRTFTKIALLFIDLDDFKSINDTYGHEAGDTVLKIVSKRMHNSIRESDLFGRYAGDEFVIALKHIEKKETVEKIVTKLLYALSQPIKLDENEATQKDLYITVSIGISLYPDDTKDIQQLINKADRAMYAVKSQKKNGYGFYNENERVS